MEPDRYQQNKVYYIIGMVFLVFGLFLFGMALYAFPKIVFGLYYSIPTVMMERIAYVQVTYQLTEAQASYIILGTTVFVGFLCVLITYFTSNHIESEIYGFDRDTEVEQKKQQETSEGKTLLLKIVIIVGLVFVVAKIFQWAISIR